MKSPPGGGMLRLAEAGEQRAGEQERRADAGGQLRVDLVAVAAIDARSATSWSSRHVTLTPRSSSSASIESTSRMRGTLPTTTSSSVRSEAASIGSAAFLLPAGTTVPESG